ncbi:hypothetical protein JB92DRAFT_3096543 [Gautieria morchelliformis]|nr:hypothetical protein JB92DRAFT_3096543 [Gautieria morchelliformis]
MQVPKTHKVLCVAQCGQNTDSVSSLGVTADTAFQEIDTEQRRKRLSEASAILAALHLFTITGHYSTDRTERRRTAQRPLGADEQLQGSLQNQLLVIAPSRLRAIEAPHGVKMEGVDDNDDDDDMEEIP